MSRRILHITESLGRAGLASQLLTLSRGLAEQGADVHVAALSGGLMAAEFRAAGIPATQLDRRRALDPIALLRLRRLVRRLRPDVVHTWNSEAAVYGRLASPSGQALVIGQYRTEPWQSAASWLVRRRHPSDSTKLVTSSVHVRNWWARHCKLPAERITVIPPGIAESRASDATRNDLRHELQLPANARLIGVIGRLVPEKRVKDLIWAADLLRVLHDNLRVLVIGDGPLRLQLEQYARMASDLEHIQFLGERDDVWRIMPHLDVLWDSSEGRSHSIAILEAMAAGVPVVASDTPMNREFVVEGETGHLVPLHERSGRADRARHTGKIFSDAVLASALAGCARRRIANDFGMESVVQRHEAMYAGLYDKFSGPSDSAFVASS